MNRIAIVGHPQSGYSYLEKILASCGMQPALPSFREGLRPEDVTRTVCKAYGVNPLSGFMRGTVPIRQIQVDPMWGNLAMDLLRGNLDQTFWGWSDSMSVYLLDYWKSAIPDLGFLLVYNHPRTALSETFSFDATQQDDKDSQIKSALAHWRAYNDALLHFYNANTDRCLMVHTEQIRNPKNTVLAEIRALLAAPFGLKDTHLLETPERIDLSSQAVEYWQRNSQSETDNGISVGDSDALAVIDSHTDETLSRQRETIDTSLAVYLADELFQKSRVELELYEELQSSASLPYRNGVSAAGITLSMAWQEMTKLLAEKRQLSSEATNLKTLTEELKSKCEETTALYSDSEEEKDTILSHMFSVQEEFESQYTSRREIIREKEKRIVELEEAEANVQRQLMTVSDQLHQVLERHPMGAEAQVKNELAYKVGITIQAHGRTVWKLIFLPISLWLVARRHRKAEKRRTGKTLPLGAYDDYEKGLKARTHLSYRLGKAWLKHIHKPWHWIFLPAALVFAYVQFRQDRKATKRLEQSYPTDGEKPNPMMS